MSEELKLCPCGSGRARVEKGEEYPDYGRVRCRNCCLMTCWSKYDYIRDWNNRPIEDKLKSQLTKRDEVIDEINKWMNKVGIVLSAHTGLDKYAEFLSKANSALKEK